MAVGKISGQKLRFLHDSFVRMGIAGTRDGGGADADIEAPMRLAKYASTDAMP
ncbi:MAG: hypothetical protein ABIQ70_11640 [Dokdonella sp.]